MLFGSSGNPPVVVETGWIRPSRAGYQSTQTIGHHTTLFRLLSPGVCVIFKMGFGDFDSLCEKAPLPLCSLVGPPSSISGSTGIIPNCYARNIELANTIIFEGASCFLHIIALGMTVIMILHIRSKFTAVGKCPHIMSLCVAVLESSGPPRTEHHLPTSCYHRSQRNYYVLLHLHGSDPMFPDP